ncbi:hypothetical protein P4O66_017247 [Electrophorus voltai]|uniref:Aladin seven-bladed propeller domain-containing protein n=1 Tax=Electrophorus voltai TaxID=2609070 RepID=A0AAD8YUU3_9TELE|nr:hypothetical protein P4O66_017247 [Electrophorus voltai]
MCSLALFPPPLPSGQITLYETNNEFVSGKSPNYYEKQITQHWDPPSLCFHRETLKPHSRPESSSKAAFLDHKDTLWMRSAGAWRDAGLSGLLDEITNSAGKVPKWLTMSSGCILALLRWMSSFHGSLFPHLTLSGEEMVAEFSEVLDWLDSAVRSFAWHPHTDKFAVALLDDSIKIYNSRRFPFFWLCWIGNRKCHGSNSEAQTAEECKCYAVEAPVCVCAGCGLPHLHAHLARRPQLTFYKVWDVAAEICVPLQRVGGGGVTNLSWSPDGSRLWAATPSALFRVWETKMWTCERWPCLRGRCQAGCWSPDGSRLLFSVQGETVIYALTFSHMTGGPKSAAVVADLSETTFTGLDSDLRVGGEVQSLAWDPTGERLAVLLKGNAEISSHPAIIAVFKTRSSPIFELLPCGFVRGEVGAEPRLIQFHSHFQHGALLTVCWSNGRISHVPFYFVSMGRPHSGGSPPPPHFTSKTEDYSTLTLYTEQVS